MSRSFSSSPALVGLPLTRPCFRPSLRLPPVSKRSSQSISFLVSHHSSFACADDSLALSPRRRNAEYQILSFTGERLMSQAERERYKVVVSTTISH